MSITSPIAQITSAPVASGLAWIVNVLMELNIKSTISIWPEHWRETADGIEIGKDAYEHLRWHLPILQDRTVFTFEPGLEVIWHHQLDFAQHPERPTILYVRDPRDAINSLYQRLFTDTGSLSEYLHRPDSWPYHFPGMFGLPPAETWAYFHLFWMAMGEVMNVKVVTFESMRADPIGITRDVLDFLGVERSDAEIAVAIERSSFQRAKEAMEKVQQETGRPFHTNRKGQVGEWKEVYSASDLRCFEGPAAYAMRQLGYALPEVIERAGQEEPAAFDTSCIPPQIDTTLQAAMRQMTQGNTKSAEALLRAMLAENVNNPRSHVALLNALVSLRWTRLIFTESSMASAPARRAFQLFLDLNFRFFGYPAIQEVLQHGQYGWSDTPCLLGKWAGFNIVHYQHTFYGIIPELSEADLPFTNAVTLHSWHEAGYLVVGKTPQEVREALRRAIVNSEQPVLETVSAAASDIAAPTLIPIRTGMGSEETQERPWRTLGVTLQEVNPIQSMISEDESLFLHWLASTQYTGEGEIIDGGPLMGGSSYALASGLAKNGAVTRKQTRIHSYDLWIYSEGFSTDLHNSVLGKRSLRPGDSLLPLFQENTRRYCDYIEPIQGDILHTRWNGRPVEILFIDCAKSWEIHNHIVRQFFGCLIPNRSVVIQQDYHHYFCYWIHLMMAFFAPYFERIEGVHGATVAFRLTCPIPRELLTIDYSRFFDKETACSLMDAAIHATEDRMRVFVQAAKVRMLVDRHAYEEAAILAASLRAAPDWWDLALYDVTLAESEIPSSLLYPGIVDVTKIVGVSRRTIVCHTLDRFYAVPRTLAHFDIAEMQDLRHPEVVSAPTLEELRVLIGEAIEPVSVQAAVSESAGERALYLCDLSQGVDSAQRELARLAARPQLADLVEANAITVLSLGERNAIGPNFAVVDVTHPDPEVVQTLAARNFSRVVLPYRNRLFSRGVSLVRFALPFAKRLMILFPDETVRVYENEGVHRLLYNTAYLDNMFRYIPRPVGGEVLEVGCSDGMVCDLMLKEGPRSIVGIDMMTNVGCNFPDPRITYANMDATAMTFASGRFDCAYSIATMEHVANPFQALMEMRRVLKRGGYGYVQAGPFYHSPFGHHMFGLFDSIPWIHLRRSKEEIIALGKATGVDARILRERGQDIETYIHGMINPLHINGLLYKQYRLEEFMALPDVETLHFERSFEGRELLTPAIRAELPQFSEDDLTAHGFELMFRIR